MMLYIDKNLRVPPFPARLLEEAPPQPERTVHYALRTEDNVSFRSEVVKIQPPKHEHIRFLHVRRLDYVYGRPKPHPCGGVTIAYALEVREEFGKDKHDVLLMHAGVAVCSNKDNYDRSIGRAHSAANLLDRYPWQGSVYQGSELKANYLTLAAAISHADTKPSCPGSEQWRVPCPRPDGQLKQALSSVGTNIWGLLAHKIMDHHIWAVNNLKSGFPAITPSSVELDLVIPDARKRLVK